MSEIKKDAELINKAAMAGFNSIIETIKKQGGSEETVLEVIMSMANYMLTDQFRNSHEHSIHNADLFCKQLILMTHETQKCVNNSNKCGVLM